MELIEFYQSYRVMNDDKFELDIIMSGGPFFIYKIYYTDGSSYHTTKRDEWLQTAIENKNRIRYKCFSLDPRVIDVNHFHVY